MICPYCDIEISEKQVEAEDGCCPECGALIMPNVSDGNDDDEFYDDDDDDDRFGTDVGSSDDFDDLEDFEDGKDF